MARLGLGHQFEHNSAARSGLAAFERGVSVIDVLMDDMVASINKIRFALFIFMISAYKKLKLNNAQRKTPRMDVLTIGMIISAYVLYRSTLLQPTGNMNYVLETYKTLTAVYILIYIHAHQFPYREMTIIANCTMGYIIGSLLRKFYYKDY
jgi:hypothetical protein